MKWLAFTIAWAALMLCMQSKTGLLYRIQRQLQLSLRAMKGVGLYALSACIVFSFLILGQLWWPIWTLLSAILLFAISSDYDPYARGAYNVEVSIWQRCQGLYGPTLWFALLGPGAAFLYFTLATNTEDKDKGAEYTAVQLLAWIPTRLSLFCLALVGSFVHTFQCYRTSKGEFTWSENRGLLIACARASLNGQVNDIELAFAQLLVRADIAWFVLLIGPLYMSTS